MRRALSFLFAAGVLTTAGCSGSNEFSVTLANNSLQTVHIFTGSESFSPDNRLDPGQSRGVMLDQGDEMTETTFVFSVGANGTVFRTVTCSAMGDPGNPRVAYGADGSLLCVDW